MVGDLAIYQRSQTVELGSTVKQHQLVVGVGPEPLESWAVSDADFIWQWALTLCSLHKLLFLRSKISSKVLNLHKVKQNFQQDMWLDVNHHVT